MQPYIKETLKGSIIKKLKGIIMISLMAPMFTACGLHYNIKGTVVNAQTNEPVQGAVVVVRWMASKLGPPGLGTTRIYDITTEDLTDEKGSFTIPKYPLGDHYMAVYQKGYVCWNSVTIFNQYGKTEDEMYIRKYEKVKNGMVVKLEPKGENFPAVKHARFVSGSVATGLSSPKPIYNKYTAYEYKIYSDEIRRKIRERKP